MRSTLKKSLYLGLAALSFASVAGVANNADAAKKAPAKTYATASYQNIPDQGQSNVAYNVTGSNALFNKPGTVKGAKQVASKATMSDLASSKQNFMVYQTATTNRGSKYIKVVSFDKQYRGWIYAGNNTSSSYGTGVQQVNLTSSASSQYSSVYLKNPGQIALKSSPEGSQFNASQNSFSYTGYVANDAFTVDSAQTVSRTGTTWYHLTDQNNSSVQGWVPSDQVQLSSSNSYFDKNNDIKVNFTDSTGNVIKSSIVDVSGDGYTASDNSQYYNTKVRKGSSVASSINALSLDNSNSNSPLYGTGYSLTQTTGVNGTNLNTTSGDLLSGLSFVEPGDTVNVPVTNQNSVSSKLNFYATNGVYGSAGINTSNVSMPSLTSSQLSQLNGSNSREFVNTDKILGNSTKGYTDNLFTNSKVNSGANTLGTLYGNDQTATSTMYNVAANDNDVYNAATSDKGITTVNKSTTVSQGSTYHYDYVLDKNATAYYNSSKTYGQKIDLYYTAVPVAGSANSTTSYNNYY